MPITDRLYKRPKSAKFPYKAKPRQRPRPTQYHLKISTLQKTWNRFLFLNYPSTAILRGNFSQSSKRFPRRTNGRQDAANCIVAIVFAKMFKMSDWNSLYIDKILVLGDELLNLSIMYKPQLRYTFPKPKDLYNNIYIDNIKITYTTEGDTITGTLYPDYSENNVDLKTGLSEYLSVHDTVLCSISSQMVAFWKKEKMFYYFDPHECNEFGQTSPVQDGRACVMRFTKLDRMLETYKKNLNLTKNADFKLLPINILRMNKVRLDLPETPYIRQPVNVFEKEVTPVVTPTESVEEVKPPEPIPPAEPKPVVMEIYEMNPEFLKTNSKLELNDDQKQLVESLEISKSKDVLPIRLKLEPEVSLTHFQNITETRGILRATTFKRPELVPSIALYSLGMLKIYKSQVWTPEIIDQILHNGHKLYKQSRSQHPSGNGDHSIVLKDVIKDFFVYGKQFTADVEHSTIIGALNSSQYNVVDLVQGTKDFFREYDCGIIQGPVTVAIWQEDGLYYMLDPCERDGKGIKVKQDEEGKGCVTWYKLLTELNNVYHANVPKSQRHDPFFISNVLITDYIEIPESWFSFTGVKPGKWICRAQFSQASSRFFEENRNCQCTPIAAMAIAFRELYSFEDWNSDILDNILLEGDEFYTITVQLLKDTNKFKNANLMVNELLRSYTLGSLSGKHRGKRVNFDIQECLINGSVSAADEHETLNLRQGLDEYFLENDVGIITAGNISITVWKYDDYYYYFDSHTLDHNGIIHGIGTACILRFEYLNDLVIAIQTNLQPVTEDLFNISFIEATIWEADESGIIKPPLNNYRRINDTSAILQATHHNADSRYFENAGKQTLSCCLVAEAMTKIMPSSLWTVTVMDEILKVGDKLHEKVYLKILETDPLFEEDLTLEQCEKAFRFGEYFVNVFIGTPISGYYENLRGNNTIYDTFLEYFQQQDNPDEPDLHKCAIFSSQYVTCALWVDLGVMYIFDPTNRDNEGFSFDRDNWSSKHLAVSEGGEAEDFADVQFEETADDEDEIATNLDSNLESEESIAPPTSKSPNGFAYCRFFTTLGTFAQHFTDNAPPNQLQETQYTITPLKIVTKLIDKEKPPIPEGETPTDEEPVPEASYVGPWYNFNEIEYGQWIIRGTHCQTDARYPEPNQGNQDASMAFMYLIFQHTVESKDWQTKIVDAVLKYGDRLHTYCRQKQVKTSEPKDIFKEYCLDDYVYKITLTEQVAEGDISAKDSLSQAILSTVEAGFRRFIITVKNKSFGVYKGEKMYYLFDPNCRGPNGLCTTVGVACLLRFMDLMKMVELLKLNLPKEGSHRFYIDGVEVHMEKIQKDTKVGKLKIPEEFTNPTAFVSITPEKMIISGTLSQEDKRFGREKKVQSPACALVALAMSLIHRPDTWTKEIIDEIIINGDKLYADSVDKPDFNQWEESLTVAKCNREFYVGINKVQWDIVNHDSAEHGILNTKDPDVFNLRQAIERFFLNYNTYGIFQCPELMYAFWKDDKFMYLFDPYPRDDTGIECKKGVACVMAFHSSKIMAEHCLANCQEQSNPFVITPIDISIIKTRGKLPPIVPISGGVTAKPKRIRPKKIPKNWVCLKGIGYLYAKFSQNSKYFNVVSRGWQAPAICIVAIVMFHLNEPNNWNQDTLNNILISGDQLYKDSYLKYRPNAKHIDLNMILRRFYVDMYRVEIVIFKPSIVGTLTELNITNGLNSFFLEEKAGVFVALDFVFGLFQKAGQFYIFDPYDRDLEGNRTSTGNGVAVLYRFNDLGDVAVRLFRNLGPFDDRDPVYEYCLHPVQIKDIIFVE